MAQTTFDEAAANRWINSVNTMNTETDQLLKKVQQCIADIRTESDGPMVEALTQVAAGLTTKFANLVSTLANLVKTLKTVIDKFRQMQQEVVNSIKTAAKQMVGGLDVNVTV